MPIMDGYEATRRIRKTPSMRDIPILALTASSFREDVIKCEESGMNDFLSKPIRAATLREAIERYC